MIFDTIYMFFAQLIGSNADVSYFMANSIISVPGGEVTDMADYLACMATIVVIALGVVALFKILGGVLRLVKPW